MYEQHGIYKVILKENIGTALYYETGTLANITTTGNELEISSCDNIYLDYKHNMQAGSGGNFLHDYVITTSFFDFTKSTLETIDQLSSIFGFIPIFYFRNGDIKALPSPLFLEEDFDYNERNTQVFNLTIKTQVLTTKKLIDYEEIVPGSGILAEDGSGILAEDNSGILTD